MAHYVPFFLTTKFGGVRYPAGPLRFDVDISTYAAVGYSAAGARSTITVSLNPFRSTTAAVDAVGQWQLSSETCWVEIASAGEETL